MENVQREEYRPEFSLTAEGRDITAVMRENLVEIRLTDNGGATAKADELQITILSETMALPSKGARLRLGLGFNGILKDKGWFVVSGISSSGPPRKIVIYATAAPMNAQRQSGDVLNQKSRSWDDVSLGDIVKTVASDNGLIPKVAGALANIAVGHLDQVNESDAALMTRLASRFNAISKPSGGYWLFLQQGESLSVSGKPLASVTILKEAVSEWSYTDGQQRGATTGPGKKGEGGKKGKISVAYFDPEDGRTKTQSLEHDGPSQSHPFTQPTKAAANHSAQSRKTQVSRNERRMTLSGPCRPAHIPLTAESRVITQGFGTVEDRSWLIESLVFSLTSQGMSFAFNLATDIKPPKGLSGKKSGKKKDDGIGYFDET